MLPGSNFVRTKFKKFQSLTPDPDTIYFLYDIGAIYLGSVCVGNTLRGKAGIVISDSEPNDPDHPVWLDPDGEVGPLDLDITGASVGQVPTIKAVDGDGKPTEWEAVTDSTPFIVEFSGGGITEWPYTSSHTFEQITVAISAGRYVIGHAEELMVSGDPSGSRYNIYFDLVSTMDVAIFKFVDASNCYQINVAIPNVENASVNVFGSYLSASSSTYGGVKADSAEGTDTQPVRIGTDGKLYTAPGSSGGGTDTSLGLTGATVGQTVKIKAVDENGVPTEWEAADAASGGSGDKEWKLLRTVALPNDPSNDTSDITYYMCSSEGYTDQIANFKFSTDNDGKPFAVRELIIFANTGYGRLENYFGVADQNGNAGYGNLACSRSRFTNTLTNIAIRIFTVGNWSVSEITKTDNYNGNMTGNLLNRSDTDITTIKFGTFVDSSIKPGSTFEFWGR